MNKLGGFELGKVHQGDCLELMKQLAIASIDTIITDPPYGINFMAKKWDYDIPSVEIFGEMLRVAKPGTILLCFAGSRTQHRMGVNIEDAGWQLKDCLLWLYGTGFPKSLNISKSIDKKFGKGRAEAEKWEGWGTALKPAYEPIIVAMKPLDNTFAENALKHGVAGLNIDGCRIESTQGRFPANIILDEEAGKMLDEQSGKDTIVPGNPGFGDSGGASRFYYCAKASKKERNMGCENFEPVKPDDSRKDGNPGGDNPRNRGVHKMNNPHPTVKPLKLMEYLCNLTKTPDGGIVLDPFAGTGTTGMACKIIGRDFLGFELDSDNKNYVNVANARIQATEKLTLNEYKNGQESLFDMDNV